MSKSPNQSQPRQENERRPPPQQAAASASRTPMQKINSSAKEPYLTKAFGFSRHSLSRDPEDPILPLPTDDVFESPAANSPHRSSKESSLDSPIRSPVRRSEKQVPVPIPQINREASFPDSPFRSPIWEAENTSPPASQRPLSTQNKKTSKSAEADETVIVTHHQSVPEHPGSPMLQSDGSPEKTALANRMAAPAATMATKMSRGGVNDMSMKSGIIRSAAMRKAEFGLRVLEVILCLVSFSVMAADKTTGWAGDSFDRYQEFRYCLSVNVIGFVYSGFQVYAQFHRRMMKRRIIDRPLSDYFDFSMDQVFAYLLMSASSAAAARNDDWITMFGSDKFTEMLNGSIAMSFLAFMAFALSSIISADKLFSWNP
ncbi:CASP-like protein 4A3 [Phalaenopsis equestris]|uniref:CASP-like protein 4A3 n=1 Tax=Phalaenopsis equestris TaxID=78828 RepID=UPI0009E2C912|nr:CASP-like protein 4A3 [Phalaenopsis equestris]